MRQQWGLKRLAWAGQQGPGNGVIVRPWIPQKDEQQGGELPLVLDSQFNKLKKEHLLAPTVCQAGMAVKEGGSGEQPAGLPRGQSWVEDAGRCSQELGENLMFTSPRSVWRLSPQP